MRGHHKVEGLVEAKAWPGRPDFIRKGRPKGAKALGCRYEESVARALRPVGAHSGLWWKFTDATGEHFCQTDLVIFGKRNALVLECKLTWVGAAWDQLKRLYVPVLEAACDRKVFPILVCKNLVPGIRDEICHTVDDALAVAKAGGFATLHWSEGRGLSPFKSGAFVPDR